MTGILLLQTGFGCGVFLLINGLLLKSDYAGKTAIERSYAFTGAKSVRVNRLFYDWMALVVAPMGLAVLSGLLLPFCMAAL